MDLDLAVETIARHLAHEHALQPDEEDLEAPVGEALVAPDLAQPGEGVDRRRARGLVLVPGLDRADHDAPRAVEAVLHHLPVALLEDREWQDDRREEPDVGQREERHDPTRHVLGRAARTGRARAQSLLARRRARRRFAPATMAESSAASRE